jgi:hypothetical protein
LRQILDQNTNSLHILGLIGILHHHLHVLFHLGKLALRCQDSDHQKILQLQVLEVVQLNFTCLLDALFLCFLNVAQKEWRLNHVQNVEVFVHIY